MNSLVIFLLLAGVCLAHYRGGYDSQNLIVRDEPTEVTGELVECPVCDRTDSWMPNHEKCNIVKGGKRYKECKLGTYVNEVCGNRLDCYRGPGEQCSEKMQYDVYGQKCGRGFYCKDVFHVCAGIGYTIDSNKLWFHNKPYRFPLRSQYDDQMSSKAEQAMLLA